MDFAFLFNHDDLLKSHQRKFKKSIESNKEDKRTIKEIITTPVNESNKSGICDIFFYHEEKSNARCDKCNEKINECTCNKVTCKFKDTETECGLPTCSADSSCKIIDTDKNTNKNYLFSAKYFSKEKGVEHYDIPSIDIEARAKLSNYNIILLVKNNLGPNGLQKKMDKSKKEITKKFHKILDLSDLDKYYKLLKYDLNDKNIDEFIDERSKNVTDNKIVIKPRFHQYFIDFFRTV